LSDELAKLHQEGDAYKIFANTTDLNSKHYGHSVLTESLISQNFQRMEWLGTLADNARNVITNREVVGEANTEYYIVTEIVRLFDGYLEALADRNRPTGDVR